MSKVITVVNRKGGVGKTAVVSAIGAWINKQGRKVLFIDADAQTNLSYCVGAELDKLSITDVFTGKADIEEVIQHTDQGDIIPSDTKLSGIDAYIIRNDIKDPQYILKRAFKKLKSYKYDYIVIDTGPTLGMLTINAMAVSDNLIIPVQADVFSLQALSQMSEEIEDIKKGINKNLAVSGILITRYSDRTILSRDMRENLEAIAGQLHTKVFKTAIRECISVKEAAVMQTDIFSYAPKSNAAKDYEEFLNEFLGDIQRPYF